MNVFGVVAGEEQVGGMEGGMERGRDTTVTVTVFSMKELMKFLFTYVQAGCGRLPLSHPAPLAHPHTLPTPHTAMSTWEGAAVRRHGDVMTSSPS